MVGNETDNPRLSEAQLQRFAHDLTQAGVNCNVIDNLLKGQDLKVCCFTILMFSKEIQRKHPDIWASCKEVIDNLLIEKPKPKLTEVNDGSRNAQEK